LSRLERQVLGSERRDDVPGADIPSRYFAYIRSGDIGPLDAVLEHNRRDLLSLAALTARLLRLLSEGASGAADPREALGLGRVYERAGLVRRASDAFNRALDLAEGSDAATQLAALRGLAGLNRRARRHDVAAIRWREILSIPGCPPDLRREAAEALAVHHEHRARDLVRARELALSALAVAAEAKRAALLYRVARIDRKLTRDPMAFSFD
jgi:tetratricopeptide (TPR) repeat protein